MDVTFKTAEQIAEQLGAPFCLPAGCTYMAVAEHGRLLVGVDETRLVTLMAAVGLGAICEIVNRLMAEAQHDPGMPVVYGPSGIERRARTRLRAVS